MTGFTLIFTEETKAPAHGGTHRAQSGWSGDVLSVRCGSRLILGPGAIPANDVLRSRIDMIAATNHVAWASFQENASMIYQATHCPVGTGSGINVAEAVYLAGYLSRVCLP